MRRYVRQIKRKSRAPKLTVNSRRIDPYKNFKFRVMSAGV